jgi:hypothetical protein
MMLAMWRPGRSARVLIGVIAASPLFWTARGPAELTAAALYALACAALSSRDSMGWLSVGWMLSAGLLLAAGAGPLFDVVGGVEGLRAHEPGHTPLIALRALCVAVTYWAVHDMAGARARGLLLGGQALAVAVSTGHAAGVALPVVVTFGVLFAVQAPAPLFPGLRSFSGQGWVARAVMATLFVGGLGLLAKGAQRVEQPSTTPPTSDDPAAQTRYWMDVVDNPFYAAPWARRWAASEADAPGEGTLRLARLGLRADEVAAARALLERVASDASSPQRRAEAERALRGSER